MKVKTNLWTIFLLFALILSACVPTTFSPPVEIHITDGDRIEQAVVAVDAAGRSHIAGVVNNRIVYYRTRYGEVLPLGQITMTMTGSGANWKQYDPDIAVLDDGEAFVTWVEQRGGPEKFACYQQIPLVPPVGGYDKDCDPLDGTEQTAGNVLVTARGSTAYAVYDRPYSDGRTADMWYKRIAGGSVTGRVAWWIEAFETVHFHSLDLGIDESGFLHVGLHYNWTTGAPPPYAEKLEIRSNRSTLADFQMNQIWLIVTGIALDEDIPVSLSFYQDGTTQRVALASGFNPGSADQIWVSSCTAVGCTSRLDLKVNLPTSWESFSVIDDVEIEGVDETLSLSFIGDDYTAPTGATQVYYTDAFDTSTILEPSEGSASFKFDLEMVSVDSRVSTGKLPVMAWAESNFVTSSHFVAGFYTPAVKISEDNCLETMVSGNIAANDIYLSGVWDACSNTWFTTQAWNTQLPLITK